MLVTRRRVVTSSLGSAFYAMNPQIQPTLNFIKRNAQGSMSQATAYPGPLVGRMTFTVDLYKAPPWSVLLPACGWDNGGSGQVWTPSSDPDDWTTCTISVNMAGKLASLASAMGKFTIDLIAGQPGAVNFEFIGLYSESDTSPGTPSYDPGIESSAPPFAAATISYGSHPRQITIDGGNALEIIESAEAATGAYRGWIGSRDITGTMDPFEELEATRGDWTALAARTEQELSIAYAGATITIPAMQITDLPPGERNGLSARAIAFQANRDASAGDDEMELDLTEGS